MKTYIQEKNGYQLEIGLGWFTIYDTVDGVIVSTGMSINFGGSHDEMRKFAIAVFDKLIKWEMNMNYEDMSDWDLGVEICKIEMRGQFITYHEQEVDDLLEAAGLNGKSDVVRFKTRLGSEQSFSINDWSRVMPIAVKYGFSVELPDDELGGVGTITKYNPKGTDYQVDFNSNDSVQRAIWICFLKMKDAEK